MNYKRVKMNIEGYTKQTKQKEYRGYNRPEILSGTSVYLIKYVNHDGFFQYGYRSHEQAQDVINTMIENETDTEQYYPFNVIYDREVSNRCYPVNFSI